MTGAGDDVARGFAEVGMGISFATAPAWYQYLAEINVVLATLSLTIGVCLGGHGLWRIIRGYTNGGRR